MQTLEALNKLDWILWKQRDIINQIKTIKEKVENNEHVEHIGYLPEEISPQALINLHKERYNILDVLKRCSEDQVEKWLRSAQSRVKNDCKGHDGCQQCFLTKVEIELLKEYENQR